MYKNAICIEIEPKTLSCKNWRIRQLQKNLQGSDVSLWGRRLSKF